MKDDTKKYQRPATVELAREVRFAPNVWPNVGSGRGRERQWLSQTLPNETIICQSLFVEKCRPEVYLK